MSEFNKHLNYYDSKIRNIIVGTLSVFKDKIKYKRFKESNVFDYVEVPFYYSYTGSEDFLYDFFMSKEYSNISNTDIDGIYDSFPRGVLTMTSLDIDSGQLVNKYVRTEVPKKVEDNLYKLHSYETMVIPLKLGFDVFISCSSNIEMFMITESLIENLYKTSTFYINYGDSYRIRVQAHLDVPENFAQNKLFEFGFSDKKTHEITFSIEISTNMPVFDIESERYLGDKMFKITNSLYDIKAAPESEITSHNDGSINPNKENMKYGDFNTNETEN